MDQYAYAPNTGSDYFHVAGCQWMLHIGSDKEPQHILVTVTGAPRNWHIYSSISDTPGRYEVTDTYDDLASSAIGGGKRSYSFQVHGHAVSVFVHGNFDVPDTNIFSAVETITRIERGWFDDYEQAFFTVVVAP